MKRSSLTRKTPMRVRSLLKPSLRPKIGGTASIAVKQKTRKCAVCGAEFKTYSTLQKWCNPDCGAELALRKLEKIGKAVAKAERAATAKRKEAIKSRAKWLAEAQAAVNAYVRERDANLPCISCGRHHQGQWHAGHYLSRGARPELRFNLDNLNKQCAPCNNHLSGNAVLYRIGLIAKIGLGRVETLEGPHDPVKYTIDQAKAIRDEYRAKLKQLKGASQ